MGGIRQPQIPLGAQHLWTELLGPGQHLTALERFELQPDIAPHQLPFAVGGGSRLMLEALQLLKQPLLTPLGLIALMLSSFLVINTISALMAQQTRQIAVM